jgi:PilZ domain
MQKERRRASRVNFARGICVKILAIDGTWQRECEMLDVSDIGVSLRFSEHLAAFGLKEFFLILSSLGTAHRRCQMIWTENGRLGAAFIDSDGERKRSSLLKSA